MSFVPIRVVGGIGPNQYFTQLIIFPRLRSRLLVVDRFTYLGIAFHKDLRQFDVLNVAPTFQYVTHKLKALEGLPLTLIGYINIFKMVLFPKLLYLNRAAPHTLPKLHFESIDRLLSPFLWRNRAPRLSRETLKAYMGAWHFQICTFITWRCSCPMPRGG